MQILHKQQECGHALPKSRTRQKQNATYAAAAAPDGVELRSVHGDLRAPLLISWHSSVQLAIVMLHRDLKAHQNTSAEVAVIRLDSNGVSTQQT
jgi:hypothetical protein